MKAYLYSYVPVHINSGDHDRETVSFSAPSDRAAISKIAHFQKSFGKNWFFTKETLSVGTFVMRNGIFSAFRYKDSVLLEYIRNAMEGRRRGERWR